MLCIAATRIVMRSARWGDVFIFHWCDVHAHILGLFPCSIIHGQVICLVDIWSRDPDWVRSHFISINKTHFHINYSLSDQVSVSVGRTAHQLTISPFPYNEMLTSEMTNDCDPPTPPHHARPFGRLQGENVIFRTDVMWCDVMWCDVMWSLQFLNQGGRLDIEYLGGREAE